MQIGRIKGNPAKRFGTRYGSALRKRIAEIEREQKAWHICPNCAQPKVKRVAIGIWRCRKCGYTFAGGAWTPASRR